MVLKGPETAIWSGSWNVVDVCQLDLVWFGAGQPFFFQKPRETSQVPKEIATDQFVMRITLVGIEFAPVEDEAVTLDLHQVRSIFGEEPHSRGGKSFLELDRHRVRRPNFCFFLDPGHGWLCLEPGEFLTKPPPYQTKIRCVEAFDLRELNGDGHLDYWRRVENW